MSCSLIRVAFAAVSLAFVCLAQRPNVLFVFADDSSEDRYELIVLDAYGDTVWQDLEVPGVSGSSVVEVEYGGPALVPGAYYQFRATSIRENPNAVSAISRTEDLRGVFIAR